MAVKLSGSAQGYSAASAIPNTGGADFTIAFWYYFQATSTSYQNVIYVGNSGNTSQFFTEIAPSSSKIDFAPVGGGFAQSTVTMTTGNWYKIAITVSGTTGSLYVQAATTASVGTPNTATWADVSSPTVFKLGLTGTGNIDGNQGRYANFKQWDGVALTAAELDLEFAQYQPVRFANLSRWTPLLDATSAPVDFSGQNNPFTAVGTPTTADGPSLRWGKARHPKRVSSGITPIVIDAGPDQSVDQYAPVTRTASETGNLGSITARSWTVVSGPNQVGETLSTSASLNWSPTVGGVYVLRYSVTNAAGTSTDDATITAFSLVFPVTANLILSGSQTGTKRVPVSRTANITLHGPMTGRKQASSTRNALIHLSASIIGQRINRVTALLKLQAAAINVGRPGKANVNANVRLFGSTAANRHVTLNRAVSALIKLQGTRTVVPHKFGTSTPNTIHLTATRTNIRKRITKAVTFNIKLSASTANRIHTATAARTANIVLAASTSNRSRTTVGGSVVANIVLIGSRVTSSTRAMRPVSFEITLHGSSFGQRIITEIASVILPRADNTTQYDLVCVARIPQSNGPPLLIEVDPIDWTSITLTEELNAPNSLTIQAKLSTLTDPVIQRTNNIDDLPTELWLFRNSKHVFAGPLLGGNVTGESIQLSANGLQSYLNGMFVAADLTFNNVDQSQIVKKLIDQWQALEYGHFGIDTSNIADSGVLRSLAYKFVEGHNVGQRIVDLSKMENGFDFEIEPGGRKVALAYPRSGVNRSQGEDAVVFDSVNVTSSTVTFSAVPGDLASEGFGAATGTGNDTVLTSTKSNLELRARYGRLGVFGTFDQVNDQATLDSYTQALVNARSNTLWIPGPDARVTVDSDISKYDIGDTVSYQLASRLSVPTSFRIRKRTITATPTGMESVTLEFV